MKATSEMIPQWALLVLPLLSLQLATVFAQLTFTTNTYSFGVPPCFVIAADVNGDNKIDLVTANASLSGVGNTLTVLTNGGSGSFGSNATLTVGSGPTCVVAADVNGDYKPDLVSANWGQGGTGHTLTVLTNNGSGAFGTNATLNTGSSPIFAVAADVNRDGALDLISANYGDRTLTVLTNNGIGTFGSNATLTVDVAPDGIAAADINYDGKLDLVSANDGGNSLTVLTNNGSGAFGSNATLRVGQHPYYVVAADINADGKLALISANFYSGTLSVLTNNASGGFGSNATLRVGAGPFAVAVADVNGDGKPDLVSANAGLMEVNGNTLTVLTNNGGGGFGSNCTLNVGTGPVSIAAADVNGDGKPDLISANNTSGSVTVLINTTVFPPPSLNIAFADNQFTLYWPAWATDYDLKSSTNLPATNWATVTNATGAGITNGMSVLGVTLTNTFSAQFFRLQR